MKKRTLSILLSFAMVFSMLPSAAFATELPETEIEETLEETEAEISEETEETIIETTETEESITETEETIVETDETEETAAETEEAVIETVEETVIETEIPETEIVSEEIEQNEDQILTSGKVGESVNFTFNKSTGELILSGSGATYDYSIGKSPFTSSDFAMAIKSVKLDDNITRLGSSLFFGTYFSNINLPSKLKEIGEHCFEDSWISSINLPTSLTKIEKYALAGKKLTSVTIPASVSSIGYAIVSPQYTSTISVSSGNFYYYAKDGVLIDKFNKTIIASTSSVPSWYKMPDDIVAVGTTAFTDNDSLEEITFSSSLKKINLSAFSYCSNLYSINLSENDQLTEIAGQAFMGCKTLTYIDLPYSLKTIGPHAFKNTAILHINIPEAVTYYQNWFDGCENLDYVHFSRNITELYVENISLSKIHYGGTKTEWDTMVASISNASTRTKLESIPTTFGYDIKLSDASKEHGKVTLTKSKMYDNETVTLTVVPDSGYKIAKVENDYDCDIKDNGDGTYEITNPSFNHYDYIFLDVSYEKNNDLTGSIYYTSSITYNKTIGIAFSSELDALNKAGKLDRVWQVLENNGYWNNVINTSNYGSVTNGLLKPGTGLIGKSIRLKVTAEGYTGCVLSKEATVRKLSNKESLTLPNISYNTSTKKIQVYLSSTATAYQLEYVALPKGTALTDSAWNYAVKGSGTSASYVYLSQDGTGSSLVTNSYYTVYARYSETSTNEAGINTAQTIIYTGSDVSIAEGGLSLNNYPSGSTIYVDIDKLSSTTLTWNITIGPSNATSWREITWTSSSAASVAAITSVGSYTPSSSSGNVVTPSSSTMTTFPSKMTLSYKGTGTTMIYAVNWSNGELIYGKWTVKFYNSSNLTTSDISFTPSSISEQTINKGEEKIFDEISALTMTPDNTTFDYYWEEGYITTTSYGSPAFTIADNDYIDVNHETGAVTGLKATDSTTVSKSAVRLYLKNVKTGTKTATGIFFKVNVEDVYVHTEEMDGLPSERKLNPSEKIQLSVKLYPADSSDTVRWSSSDTSVATVASDGTVTAVDSGDCLIYARAGARIISCKIHVNMEVQVAANNATVTYNGEKTNFFCEGQTATIKATDQENFCKWEVIEGSLDNVYGPTIQYVVGTEHLTVTAVSHKVAYKRYVAATCREDGSTGGTSCSVCKKELTQATVIPATGHVEGEPVEEVKKAATYSETGITDTVCYCTKCGEEVFRCSVDVPKLTMSAPVLSKVANAVDGVTITWKATEGAAKYRVYKKVSGGSFSAVSYVTGTSYTDKKAVNGTTYYYTVKPVAADGTIVNSYDKTGLKIKYMKGVLTSEYTLTNNTNYITVKWPKNTEATGYLVYRKAGSGSYVKVATIKDNTTVTYKDSDVKNGVLYTYLVRPTGGTHTVASQGAKIIRLTAPSIKTLANSSAGALKVTLTAANSKASGYQIEYSLSSSFSSSKKVNITSNATLTKTLSSLTKGKTYYVRVRSYRKNDGATYYSAWSATKYLKITK